MVSLPIDILLHTFVVGIAVAMPVGAMGVLCIERTLHGGWRWGLATGAGIATADAVYASIAAFGITAVSTLLIQWQGPVRVVGGTFLVFLGAKTVLEAGARRDPGGPMPPKAKAGGLYASAVALTLTNPMTIMAFAGVFMSAGLVASASPVEAALATLGVAAGSLAWWIVLTGVTAVVRHGASGGLTSALARVSGVLVAGYGIVAIASAFMR